MPFAPRTIVEPFRVKMVEPLPFRTREIRAARLIEARHNLFAVHAEDVTIDLMTDSGTSAMSQDQWAAMIRGDESYAGARSFYELRDAVRSITGLEHVIPTHQGRAAEHILFSTLAAERETPGRATIVSNSHFDTTRANVEATGMRALDLPIAEAKSPRSEHPFKGDLDVAALDAFLAVHAADVPLVLLTVTSNSVGGQPVSMANARAVRAVCDRHGVPLFFDCARFAENAWLVRQREPSEKGRPPIDIAREMFSLADGALMSAKKDAFGNIGGFLALRDPNLAERCRQALVLTEGFPTYGGLAGRDLAALAVGLHEVLDERYLEYRIASIAYLFDRLDRAGVPLLRPAGGHAVYLDARAFLPHVPPSELPGQSVSIALFLEAGVRSVEIGTAMFGHTRPDGTQEPAPLDLVRLAIPRRVYTQSHIDYVAEAVAYVHGLRRTLGGYRLVDEPKALRHFTCGFVPLPIAPGLDVAA